MSDLGTGMTAEQLAEMSNREPNGQHWVFAHDSWFARRGKEVYARGPFPASFWERYREHATRLTVLARHLPVYQYDEARSLSSTERVAFELRPTMSGMTARLSQGRNAKSVVRRIVRCADAVIARLPSEYGLLAAAEASRADKPWAAEVVGCPWDALWNYGTWQGKAYAPLMAARVRWAAAKAPYVLYVTQSFLQRRYPNRGGVAVGCSDVEIPAPEESVLAERLRRIANPYPPLVLGLIGTLNTRYKGVQTVFKALGQVRGQLPSVQFRILGGGNLEPWRAEAAHHGVEDLLSFDGTLPAGEAVLKWLDGIDIYLQPSLKEGLPRALIEAMSRGCPAIASSCGGIPELLERGCLIEPGDASRLAALIRRAVEDHGWRRQQATRNWREASEYSSEKLDARRRAFWAQFAADIAKGRGLGRV